MSRAASRARHGADVVAVVVLLAGAACSFGGARRGEEQAPPPVARAERGEFRVVVEEVGVLRASRGERIRVPIWGTVSTLADDGADVAQGDVVVQLDTAQFEEQMAQLEAELAESRSEASKQVERLAFQAKSQQLDLAASRANLEFAERRLASATAALADAERQLGLGLISAAARDAKEDALRSAEYETERARVAHERKEQDIASQARGIEVERQEAETTFRQLDARRKDLLDEIERTTIRSPVAGRLFYLRRQWRGSTEERKIRVGDMVGPSSGAIAELPDLSSIEVRSQVDEALLGRVFAGTPAEIRVGAVDGLTLTGSVSRVDVLGLARSRSEGAGFQGEKPNPEAREQVVFPTTIALEGTDERLQPGMTVQVTYILDTLEDVVSVPQAAVFGGATDAFVFVKAADEAERRSVQLGPASAGRVVVAAGLEAGEEIFLADPRPDGDA